MAETGYNDGFDFGYSGRKLTLKKVKTEIEDWINWWKGYVDGRRTRLHEIQSDQSWAYDLDQRSIRP